MESIKPHRFNRIEGVPITEMICGQRLKRNGERIVCRQPPEAACHILTTPMADQTIEVGEKDREVASRLLSNVRLFGLKASERYFLRDEIALATAAARREQKEVDAKIAEAAFVPAHTYNSENATEYRIYDNGQRCAMANVAAAIRGEQQ